MFIRSPIRRAIPERAPWDDGRFLFRAIIAMLVLGVVAIATTAFSSPAYAGSEWWRGCGGHTYEGCDGNRYGPYARQRHQGQPCGGRCGTQLQAQPIYRGTIAVPVGKLIVNRRTGEAFFIGH